VPKLTILILLSEKVTNKVHITKLLMRDADNWALGRVASL